MMARTHDPLPTANANDRLKESFGGRLALSLVAATLLHVMVFALWPTMAVEALDGPMGDVVLIVPEDPIDLPPAPEKIQHPARPVVAAEVSAAETTPVVTWQDAAELLPPPPDAAETVTGHTVPFTPYTLAPSLLDPDGVQRLLGREYPPMLRDAGVGGVVALLVHVGVEGQVLEARIGASSGMRSLDDAALRVADQLRFRAALNRDKVVAVWIRLPVTFRVR